MDKVLWPIGHQAQGGMVVGFNLPFDLSRRSTEKSRLTRVQQTSHARRKESFSKPVTNGECREYIASRNRTRGLRERDTSEEGEDFPGVHGWDREPSESLFVSRHDVVRTDFHRGRGLNGVLEIIRWKNQSLVEVSFFDRDNL